MAAPAARGWKESSPWGEHPKMTQRRRERAQGKLSPSGEGEAGKIKCTQGQAEHSEASLLGFVFAAGKLAFCSMAWCQGKVGVTGEGFGDEMGSRRDFSPAPLVPSADRFSLGEGEWPRWCLIARLEIIKSSKGLGSADGHTRMPQGAGSTAVTVRMPNVTYGRHTSQPEPAGTSTPMLASLPAASWCRGVKEFGKSRVPLRIATPSMPMRRRKLLC